MRKLKLLEINIDSKLNLVREFLINIDTKLLELPLIRDLVIFDGAGIRRANKVRKDHN